MVFSLEEWVRVGVIYNYNTRSEASPNPKKLCGALQAMRRSKICRHPMTSKLLFIFGIVLAHGAVAAGLMHDQTAADRQEVALTCSAVPTAAPYFSPPRELLAMTVIPPTAGDVTRP
jgi:hypothetical protein